MKLNCVNLFANYANVINSNKLQKKCNIFEKEIENGKKMINFLNFENNENKIEIKNLNERVDDLNTEVETQKTNLSEATNKYYTSITELEQTMSFHQKIIKVS
jgi:flagellar motility protein MotE (MotC chaperone)